MIGGSRGVAAALALALAVSCSSPGGGGPASGGAAKAPTGQPIADFEAKDLTGKTVRLSDSAGTVRLVDFWATWCAPCRAEIPMFKDLHARYGPQGFTLLAVSDEDGEVVRKFVAEQGIPWTNLLDTGEIADRFGGVLGLPTAFLLDREGRLVARFGPGAVPRSVLEPRIRELVEAKAGRG